MRYYLKDKPVWVRMMVLGFLVAISSVVLLNLALVMLANATGFKVEDFVNPKLSDSRIVEVYKWLLFFNSVAVFLLPSLIYAWLSHPRPAFFLRAHSSAQPKYWFFGVIIILAAFPSAFWLGHLNQQLDLKSILPGVDAWMRSNESSNSKIVEAIMQKQTQHDLLVNLFVMGFMPALCEEIFFRGLILKGLVRVTKNAWFGIIVSAIIFSAVHLQFLTFLTRFEMGLILGILFWYSGSLWVPVLAHFIFNGVQVYVAYAMKGTDLEKEPAVFNPGLVALSFAVVTLIAILCKKHSTTNMGEVLDDDEFHIGPKDQYIA